MRKISSVIMACAMCLSMAVVGTVAPKVAVQAEVTAEAELKEAPTTVPEVSKDMFGPVYTLDFRTVSLESWLDGVTSVEVNGKEYTKAKNSSSVEENQYYAAGSFYNIKVGNKEFTKETNIVKVVSTGYKPFILEVNTNAKKVKIHTHDYAYKFDGTHHWQECQTEGCGDTTEKEAHKGGTATTTKKAVCEVCGASYGDLKQDDPKPAATTTVKNDTKPATQPAKKTVKAKKVVVNKKKIVLKKGKKAKIKVKLVPAKATEKVTFKTSNKKVAKVTKSGVVKAVKKGKCKITVKTASGKKAVVKVTVK